MVRRIVATAVTTCALFLTALSSYGQVSTSANVDAKQPDRMMLETGLKAMKDSKYAVARTQFRALINTYPDSGYVPRAKLAIGDAWYAEGDLQKAEMEYQDFVTFFPKRPEVARVQSRIDLIRKTLENSR